MTDASPTLLNARRALFLALTHFLEKEEAVKAVNLWRVPAGEPVNPLSGLRRYCHQITERFGLQGREAELHLAILRAMKGQGISRPANDPDNPRLGTSGFDSEPAWPNSLPPVRAEPSAYLMERLLATLEQHVAEQAPKLYSQDKWRASLMQHVRRIKPVNQADLHNWLMGRSNTLNAAWLPRADGTRLANAGYVVVAHWLGPVKADALFQQVLTQFETSDEAALRSVRSYL
jgi:hypothetical protein